MPKYGSWLECGHAIPFERGLEAGDGYGIGDKVLAAGFVPPTLLGCKTYGEVARDVTDGFFN